MFRVGTLPVAGCEDGSPGDGKHDGELRMIVNGILVIMMRISPVLVTEGGVVCRMRVRVRSLKGKRKEKRKTLRPGGLNELVLGWCFQNIMAIIPMCGSEYCLVLLRSRATSPYRNPRPQSPNLC